ncbi:MAG: GYD domain-containing protein [Dehalococcoidia bacterium]
MPTYITLMRWTQKGVENIKESPTRLAAAKEAVKAAGGELKAFYLVMGQYDMVAISEAPSDEAYVTIILALASGGAIRTETLRAFTEDEYRKIIAAMP